MNILYPDEVMAEARLRPHKLIGSEPLPGGDCLNCGGMGHVYIFKIDGGPYTTTPQTTSRYIGDLAPDVSPGWYTGQTHGYPCPVCSGHRRDVFLLKVSGLSPDDMLIKWPDFWAKPGKEDAKEYLQNAVADSLPPAGFVTLYGGYGVGKTMLLKLSTSAMIARGIPAAYRTMTSILEEARKTYGEEKPTADADTIVARYANINALFLDEVDRINPTAWALDVVFRLLDARYRNMVSRFTVLATNKSPDSLPETFGYLSSRMNEGILLPIGGDDMRRQEANQKSF